MKICSKILLGFLSIAVGCVGGTQDQSHYTQISTGQVLCYDVSGNVIDAPAVGDSLYGQDGNYLRGAQMSFRDNGDGTVTDLNTGLTWQQTPPAQGVVWAEAEAYCDELELGGYDDWRLPTLKELFSISNFSQGWPYIDTTYFKLSSGIVDKNEQYWSSNKYVGETVEGRENAAFGVNHVTGHIKAYAAGSSRTSQRGGDGQQQMGQGEQRGGQQGGQRGGQGGQDGQRPERGQRPDGVAGDSTAHGRPEGGQRPGGGQQGGQRPERPEGAPQGGQDGQRPERPEGAPQGGQDGQRPERPEGAPQGGQDGQRPERPAGGQQQGGQRPEGAPPQAGQGGQGGGMMMNNPMAKRVRAVRGTTYGVNKFVDNNDGTISDQATGLMWAKEDNGKGIEWVDALVYAEGATLAGYSDWRLPNVKELQGIVNYERAPKGDRQEAAIDTIFTCTPFVNEAGDNDFGYYWTGTSASFRKGTPFYFAWYVAFGRAVNNEGKDFHGAGAVRFDSKSDNGQIVEGGEERYYNFVRLVRDIPATKE